MDETRKKEAGADPEVERLAERLARCEERLALRTAQAEDLNRRVAALVGADNIRQVHLDNLRHINHNLRRQNEHLRTRHTEIVESLPWRLFAALRRLRRRLSAVFGSR